MNGLSRVCCLVLLVTAPFAQAQLADDSQRPADWVFQPELHEVDLGWKQRIESNLLWMIDRAKRPVKRQPDAPLVGVYADAGVWPLGAQSVVASLEAAGVSVELLDWSRLQNGDLSRYHAIVFPGGYSWFQQLSAGPRGLEAVRDYVQQGGRYLGICAGAFLAAREVHWEGEKYSYPLVLFDGVAEGSIREIAAWPAAGRAKLSVTAAGRNLGIAAADGREIYYQGGCRFTGGSDVTTLATYFDGSPAIIRRPFGRNRKGTVVLTGVHFERPAPSTDGRASNVDPPPLLSRQLLPRLLELKLPAAGFRMPAFTPEKYQPTVSATTTADQWTARQRELRVQLRRLRSSQPPTR